MWRDVVDGVEVEVMEFDDTVESVEKASRLSGYPASLIVKTLLLRVGNGYLIAVARGDRRVDWSKAEKIFEKKVALAKPDEVKALLGVEVGAVTPISLKVKSFRVVLDPAILNQEFIVCGGGALNRLFKVKVKDLVNYLNPTLIDIFK
ncbi:MAG: YbaK/EbsC family protein [Ignisphaera sp.]|nr:YbaK/EbsC family protein [Ignisphaera sp.]MCC6055450.1 YbaK/EbsC family protein [Desulfurococcaceae archaeon]